MSRRSAFALSFGLALVAAILMAPSARAAIQTAGTLFVDLNATHATAGSANWANTGSLGGSFAEGGNPVLSNLGPNANPAVTFDGVNDYYRGPAAPIGLTGAGAAGTRSIEVWAWNPAIAAEETLVSLARRGGPDGTNVAFNYGSNGTFGAAGQWGTGPDIGWNGVPAAGQWHHLVYTYDGTRTTVYADGKPSKSEPTGSIDAHDGIDMLIAAQMEPNGTTVTPGVRGSLSIAQVRVHDGVLSREQVINNFNTDANVFGLAPVSTGGTLAYWRFEGPANTDIPHGAANGFPNFAADVPDSSGNGNALSMWQTGGGAGFAYRSDVPAPFVPETNLPNTTSMRNTGAGPAAYTFPNGPLSSMELKQWTIEVSWKPENGGFRTVVGRDARGVASLDGGLSALYLQAVPGDALAIKFTDEAGIFHEAVSAPDVVQGFNFGSDPNGLTGVWHNIAAVSDGNMLSLYLDKGDGYMLIAQTSLAGSPNSALTDGFTSVGGIGGAGDWTAGGWSVGRGLFAGGHADRAFGFIDEVRISDIALNPSEFLFAPVPEPATTGLALMALAGLGLRRRKRA